jgi:hypothetical protein
MGAGIVLLGNVVRQEQDVRQLRATTQRSFVTWSAPAGRTGIQKMSKTPMRLRVQVTNGDRTISFLWATWDDKDLYYHWSQGDGNLNHFSYHESGRRHTKRHGQYQDAWHDIPLADLKSWKFISGFLLPNPNAVVAPSSGFKPSRKKSKDKQPTSVVTIDSRQIPQHQQVQIFLFATKAVGGRAEFLPIHRLPGMTIYAYSIVDETDP